MLFRGKKWFSLNKKNKKLSCGMVRNLVHFLLVVETIILKLVLNLVPR
eukprot:SAG11_NODE_30716_length_298_cov_0.969849_1_plen_47_part_10